MKRNLVVLTAFVVIGGLSLLLSQSTGQAKAAAAAFPEGQWTFESKDTTGALYSTNGICIQSGGTWYATTSGLGSGHWYMKGKSIHLHGNYAGSKTGGAVNDSFELTAKSQKLLTGYLQEWNDSGSYDGYYTSNWTFTSSNCDSPSK